MYDVFQFNFIIFEAKYNLNQFPYVISRTEAKPYYMGHET